MTMTAMAVLLSEASAASKRGGLRGPRPQPLKVSSSSRGSSPTAASKPPSGSRRAAGAAPVIVYEHTPRVVHARRQEFMTVVQRLTGKRPAPVAGAPAATAATSSMACAAPVADPLLLTLGQRQAPALPSPMAAGLLMSPGFIFSPNTMQSIQELSPLF